MTFPQSKYGAYSYNPANMQSPFDFSVENVYKIYFPL